jgi:riboflavin synthase
MVNIRRILATAGSSAVLALGLTGAAAADATATNTNNCSSSEDFTYVSCENNSHTTDVNIDKSKNYTVNGNCSRRRHN